VDTLVRFGSDSAIALVGPELWPDSMDLAEMPIPRSPPPPSRKQTDGLIGNGLVHATQPDAAHLERNDRDPAVVTAISARLCVLCR
jgi:hypothetical protein